jgi:hypothetical protein
MPRALARSKLNAGFVSGNDSASRPESAGDLAVLRDDFAWDHRCPRRAARQRDCRAASTRPQQVGRRGGLQIHLDIGGNATARTRLLSGFSPVAGHMGAPSMIPSTPLRLILLMNLASFCQKRRKETIRSCIDRRRRLSRLTGAALSCDYSLSTHSLRFASSIRIIVYFIRIFSRFAHFSGFYFSNFRFSYPKLLVIRVCFHDLLDKFSNYRT